VKAQSLIGYFSAPLSGLLKKVKNLNWKGDTTQMKKTQLSLDQLKARESFLKRREEFNLKRGRKPTMEKIKEEIENVLGPIHPEERINIWDKVKALAPDMDAAIGSNVFVIGTEVYGLELGGVNEKFMMITSTTPNTYTVTATLHGKPVQVEILRQHAIASKKLLSLLNALELHPHVIRPVPRFSVDDIVFLAPKPGKIPSIGWPAVGTDYEKDLKILSVNPTQYKLGYSYQVYTPSVGTLTIGERHVLSVNDRIKYLHPDYFESMIGFDASPFFRDGETVRVYDGKVHNLNGTVIVPLTDELKQQFKQSIECITQDK
jgi:hypothetical protein